MCKQGIPNLRGIAIGQGNLFDEYRLARAEASLQGMTVSSAPTTLLSMYRSTDREFDFVVLVVEPRDHSAGVTVDELRRPYYVSATRTLN